MFLTWKWKLRRFEQITKVSFVPTQHGWRVLTELNQAQAGDQGRFWAEGATKAQAVEALWDKAKVFDGNQRWLVRHSQTATGQDRWEYFTWSMTGFKPYNAHKPRFMPARPSRGPA